MVLDTGHPDVVMAVVFHPDGKHLLGGGDGGIRQWRLADSDAREVGKQTGIKLRAICVSRDQKWIVCGADPGASVWDAEMHEKLIDVEGTKTVSAVDVSPDSARFVIGTGYGDEKASVWNLRTGERLVGPLRHDNAVAGVKFSPDGEHIATFIPSGSVRIFDSHSGDQLIAINTTTRPEWPITPLVWSNDGHQLFTVSNAKQIKSFSVSTGSQLVESPILNNDHTIALAGNGKFIATVANHAISFLDTTALTKIGTAINDSERMWSVAISSDSSQIATGRADGKIIIRDLADFLPDSYGPFHVSI